MHLKFRLTAVRDDELMSIDGSADIDPDSRATSLNKHS